jgi:hypothetical protein
VRPEHEAGIVGSMLTWPPAIDKVLAAGLTSNLFTDPDYASLFRAIVEVHGRGERVDDDLIHVQAGVDHALVVRSWDLGYGESGAAQAARDVVEAAVTLRLGEACSSVVQAAADGMPVAALLSMLGEAIDGATRQLPVQSRPLDEVFVAEAPYDWVIPGLLERGNRMLITAAEGRGKTELLIQLAVQAAAGIHPWTLRPVPPVKVLFVDLELGERDVGRRLRRIASLAPKLNRSNLRWACRPEGVNLLAGDGAWLNRELSDFPADLLVIGPLYNAFSGVAERGDVGGEDMARRLVSVFNKIRTRFRLALVMETHAPHAQAGAKRDLRPFGSSLFLRWPDFGLGLQQDEKHENRYLLTHWRGPRDKRAWPTALDQGEIWPWTAYFANGMPATDGEQ